MSVEAPHLIHVHLRSWEWWLTALVALAAAAFGAHGLWLYESLYGEHADPWSVGYHTLQLFALHAPHLEHAVPWQLNLGRWLAAMVVLGTVARGLLTVFRSECRLFWARLGRGHIVICGLGRLGMQLAREFRRAGKRVVAIEASGSAGQIATAHDAGVAVITGDACSPNTLLRGGWTGVEDYRRVRRRAEERRRRRDDWGNAGRPDPSSRATCEAPSVGRRVRP